MLQFNEAYRVAAHPPPQLCELSLGLSSKHGKYGSHKTKFLCSQPSLTPTRVRSTCINIHNAAIDLQGIHDYLLHQLGPSDGPSEKATAEVCR